MLFGCSWRFSLSRCVGQACRDSACCGVMTVHFLSHDRAQPRAGSVPSLFLLVIHSCGVQTLPIGPDFAGAAHRCQSQPRRSQ